MLLHGPGYPQKIGGRTSWNARSDITNENIASRPTTTHKQNEGITFK